MCLLTFRPTSTVPCPGVRASSSQWLISPLHPHRAEPATLDLFIETDKSSMRTIWPGGPERACYQQSAESHHPPKSCKTHSTWRCLALLLHESTKTESLLSACYMLSGVATPTSLVSITMYTNTYRPHRKPLCPHPDRPPYLVAL